jgi:hypothetical protein
VTDAAVAAIEGALGALRERLPELRDYRYGRDLGLTDGGFDFAVVADFDDVDGYAAYRDDPEHRRILAELVRPVITDRAVVQYEI